MRSGAHSVCRSSDKPHYIEKLPAGDYTLTEVKAPDGYAFAESVPFTVLPTGEMQQFEMLDDKVNVIATEYALNLKVPAYHMGTIIDEICARKGWERPWFVSESEERHCVSNAVASTSFGTPNDNLLGETP